MPRRLRPALVALLAAVSLVTAAALVPASASPAALGVPTGMHAVAETESSFTIALNAATDAKVYWLYASTTESDVYVANILAGSHVRTTHSSAPLLALSELAYTTATYYYRVEATDGTPRHFGAIESVHLRPPTPTTPHVTSSSVELHLTWHSVAATGFAIAQGTNAVLSAGRVNYTIRGQSHVFSPYGLATGTTYYFRIAAMNGLVKSHYSSLVTATVQSREQGVRVMTYNILEASSDGTSEGGQVVAAWSARRVVAAHLIEQGDPDVIGVQEGATWIGAAGHTRQVDSLSSALGSTYTVAHTEISPGQPHAFRTGCYILYRTSSYAAVGDGGYWTLPYARYAAYQILQNRASGARFLFVSTHFLLGSGATNDAKRETEATSLIAQADAVASAARVGIVYAGDFNSDVNKNHAFDGPSVAMVAAHAVDAFGVAQSLTNPTYDSANLYERTPPATGASIDHIYASQGVGVRSWDLLLDLSHGQFVGTVASDHNPLVSDVYVPF